MAVVAWLTLRQRSLVGMLLVFGFLLFGLAAAALYHPAPSDFRAPNLGESGYSHTDYLVPFLAASLATWIGVMLVSTVPGRHRLRGQREVRIVLPPKALLFAPIPLFLYLIGTGVGTFLQSSAYLQRTGPTVAFDLAHGLGPIGVLLCGYFMFDQRSSRAVRVSAGLLAACYEVFYFGAATRTFAFWPVLVVVGGYLTGCWSTRQQQIAVGVAAVIAILALQIPLGLRQLPEHGLIPAVGYVLHQPSLVFGGYDPFRNFLYGAPLTLYVAHDVGHLPAHELFVSLNPLPSSFTDWAAIGPTLEVTSYMPYSALGELLNHGWLVFYTVMTGFGAAFAGIERLARRGPGILGGVSELAVIAVGGLFLLQATEYQLRTVARLVYYVFFVVLVLAVVLPRLMGPARRQRLEETVAGRWKQVAPAFATSEERLSSSR